MRKHEKHLNLTIISNLLTKILPGRTQAEIKWNLPSKDCNSFKEAFFFLNQDSTNNEISKILSAVTSKVNFSESNNTPKNIILVVGSTLFPFHSSSPQESNNSSKVLYKLLLPCLELQHHQNRPNN